MTKRVSNDNRVIIGQTSPHTWFFEGISIADEVLDFPSLGFREN